MKYLWVQVALKAGRFTIQNVSGERHPADVLTKPKSAIEMMEMRRAVGGEVLSRSPWTRPSPTRRMCWADECDSD